MFELILSLFGGFPLTLGELVVFPILRDYTRNIIILFLFMQRLVT